MVSERVQIDLPVPVSHMTTPMISYANNSNEKTTLNNEKQ